MTPRNPDDDSRAEDAARTRRGEHMSRREQDDTSDRAADRAERYDDERWTA